MEDLKGKIVLLTFWFPGCGPCRAEFPHFESVMKKFSKDDVAYLAVNGMGGLSIPNFLPAAKILFSSLFVSYIYVKKDVLTLR